MRSTKKLIDAFRSYQIQEEGGGWGGLGGGELNLHSELVIVILPFRISDITISE